MGVLVALRAHEELAVHVRGAVRNGLSASEIGEVLLHTAVYAGMPAALAALRVADVPADPVLSGNAVSAAADRASTGRRRRTSWRRPDRSTPTNYPDGVAAASGG